MTNSVENIFVSTGAFIETDLAEILRISSENRLNHIELSSGLTNRTELMALLEETAPQFTFLIHNYFPPPERPFVLNLASNDTGTITLSREHCKRAIRLCAQLCIPIYSVHAGFCFHAKPYDLGKKLHNPKMIPRNEAKQIFIESLIEICEYGKKFGVDIAVENNVLKASNLVDGKNRLLLWVEHEEILETIETVGAKGISLLLDLGHLHVSSKTLGFDPDNFIRCTAPHVKVIHFSDNNGLEDANDSVNSNSWFWPSLNRYLTYMPYCVIEAYHLPVEQIQSQVSLIRKQFGTIIQ